MAAFDARLKAYEGTFFLGEQKLALERHVERLVAQGKLPESALRVAAAACGSSSASVSTAHLPSIYADLPTTVRGRPAAEAVYNHKKGYFPLPSASVGEKLTVGTRISLGRARWAIEDASIFSVADGKRLAQAPVKETTTPWENARFARMQAAARETPLIGGYRLLPELTPGRAFLWGSIMAAFGTAAAVKLTAQQLGIKKAEDAPLVLRALLEPYGQLLAAQFEPLRDWLSLASISRADLAHSNMAKQMRVKLSGNAAAAGGA